MTSPETVQWTLNGARLTRYHEGFYALNNERYNSRATAAYALVVLVACDQRAGLDVSIRVRVPAYRRKH